MPLIRATMWPQGLPGTHPSNRVGKAMFKVVSVVNLQPQYPHVQLYGTVDTTMHCTTLQPTHWHSEISFVHLYNQGQMSLKLSLILCPSMMRIMVRLQMSWMQFWICSVSVASCYTPHITPLQHFPFGRHIPLHFLTFYVY